jgi:hypothetical protein
MTASVQLVEALGGGWDASQLPSKKDVAANTPEPATSAAPAKTTNEAPAPSNP